MMRGLLFWATLYNHIVIELPQTKALFIVHII